MRRSTNLLVLMLAVLASGPAAADIDEMLNASAWVLTWETDFTAAAQRPESGLSGVMIHTDSVRCSHSATLLLNMRNGGPNLSTMKLAHTMPQGSTPTAAQQKQIMDLVLRSDIANWMYASPEAMGETLDASDSAWANTGTGMAQLLAVEVRSGSNLVDEMGSKFNYFQRTTRKGSGMVATATGLVFEIDGGAKRYLMFTPHHYGDRADSLATLETYERVEFHGSAPTETTKSQPVSIAYPRQLEISDSTKLMGSIVFLEGDIDPAASVITGEATIPGYYIEQPSRAKISGMIHIRYTLTPR